MSLHAQRAIIALHEKLVPKLIHECETDVKNDSNENVGSAVFRLVLLGGTKPIDFNNNFLYMCGAQIKCAIKCSIKIAELP